MTEDMDAAAARSATRKLRVAVRRQVEAQGLDGATLLIAVSGGPDSLALAHALTGLRDEMRLRLFAAHLDHGLRPEASADALFVQERMDALNMPLTVDAENVGAYRAKRRLSVEEAARHVRYDFLARVADERTAVAVAVGHTLDDQAETVLMHLLRGAGIAGLGGMTALSQIPVSSGRLTLFRPMLSLSKGDTVAYCVANGLSPRFDETNLSVDMTRNRIRLDLLPRMAEYNPAIVAALGRLAESAARDYDFIIQEVDRIAERVINEDTNGVSLDRRAFRQLHPAVRRHLLRRAVETFRQSPAGAAAQEPTQAYGDLAFAHVEEMNRLMLGPSGKWTRLPGGITLQVSYRHARISRYVPPRADPATPTPD